MHVSKPGKPHAIPRATQTRAGWRAILRGALAAAAWAHLLAPPPAAALFGVLKTGGRGELLACQSTPAASQHVLDGERRRHEWRLDAVRGGEYRIRVCTTTGSARDLFLRVLSADSVGGENKTPTAVASCRQRPNACRDCTATLEVGREYTVRVAFPPSLDPATIHPTPFSFELHCPATSKDTLSGPKGAAVPSSGLRGPDGQPGKARKGGGKGVARSCAGETLVIEDYPIRRWETVESESGGNMHAIPWQLFMTYGDKSKVPPKVFTALRRYAPAYNLTLFDDAECLRYLRRYFGRRVARRFECTPNGAHRADLFRYALLYHRGGVYLDVKTVLIRPLRELFTDRTRAYTVLSFLGGSVYQGILATPPRNPAIWRMLVSLLRVPPATVDLQYDLVTKQAHDILTNEFKVPMQAGVQLGAQGRTQWTFFNEECALAPKSGCVGCSDVLRGKQCTNADADRYGYCCVIFMGAQPAFHTRYKDFPW